jgi:hypothetical protein
VAAESFQCITFLLIPRLPHTPARPREARLPIAQEENERAAIRKMIKDRREEREKEALRYPRLLPRMDAASPPRCGTHLPATISDGLPLPSDIWIPLHISATDG